MYLHCLECTNLLSAYETNSVRPKSTTASHIIPSQASSQQWFFVVKAVFQVKDAYVPLKAQPTITPLSLTVLFQSLASPIYICMAAMPFRFDSVAPPQHNSPTDWIRKHVFRSTGTSFQTLISSRKTHAILRRSTLKPTPTARPRRLPERKSRQHQHALVLPKPPSKMPQTNSAFPLPSPNKVRSLAKHEIKREHADRRAHHTQQKHSQRSRRHRASTSVPALNIILEDSEHAHPPNWPLPAPSESDASSGSFFDDTSSDEEETESRSSVEEARLPAKPNAARTRWIVQPPMPGRGPLNSHPCGGPEAQRALYARSKPSRTIAAPRADPAIDTHDVFPPVADVIANAMGVCRRGDDGPALYVYQAEYITYLLECAQAELLYADGVAEYVLDDDISSEVDVLIDCADVSTNACTDECIAPPKSDVSVSQRNLSAVIEAGLSARGRRKSAMVDEDEEETDRDSLGDTIDGRRGRVNSISSDVYDGDSYDGDDSSVETTATSIGMRVKAVLVDA